VDLALRISTVLWIGLFTLSAVGQQSTDKSPNTVRISGTVIDDCRDEVRYASVLLLPRDSGIPQATAHTDDEGTFLFVDIAPSIYDLKVTAPGYKPVITLANASHGDASVAVHMDGPILCPTSTRPLKYVHSPLPQSLSTRQAQVHAEGAEESSIFPRLTVCDLVKNPDHFNGKMVTVVRALVEIDFEQFELSAKGCNERMADGIWLQYGRGPKSQPTTWCCGDLTPADSLILVQDSAFKLFHRYITAHRSHCLAPRCNLYRVTATLTGRLDTVPSALCADGKRRCPEKGGFGHFGQSTIRLVIQSVSDVTGNPIDRDPR